MKTKAFRIFSIVMLGILTLILLTVTAGAVARSNMVKNHPAPGQLVDVGGYKLHLNCTGEGSPTVILEAGQGDYSLVWAYVQPEVAKSTRVCSYDRAGYGWSETGPQPRTASAEIEELHTLLAKGGIEGPYILVGHSLGGMLVRVYAHSYPAEVIGMVLVDPFHEERPIRNPEVAKLNQDAAKQMPFLAFLNSTGIMALVPQLIPNRGLPPDAYAQLQAITATTGFFEAFMAEISAVPESAAEVRALNLTDFGDLPLIVLSPSRVDPIDAFSEAENLNFQKEMVAQQSELVTISTDSKQVFVEGSGHDIQLDQPELVVVAIQELLAGHGK